ncbi:hypothetical protein IWW50_006054, partial [Coemansia erecta]
MQQYYSNDDNYLQLSQQSAASGGSGASTAGPQPYRNSYPLHEPHTPGSLKTHHNPAAAAAAHTAGGPMPYTPVKPQHLQPQPYPQPQQQQRPFAYPEVFPPPLQSAHTAPQTAYGQQWPPATMPPSGNTFWGQVPEVAPKTFHSSPYPTLQQQYIPPPPPRPPVAAMPTDTPISASRPGYYRIPKNNRPPRSSSIGHSRPPNAPSAFYPQSAPISPTNGYELYANAAQPQSHTYHQADMYPVPGHNAQPLSAPAPQPYAMGQPVPPLPIAMGAQVTSSSRPSSGRQTPVQKKHPWAKSPPNSSTGSHDLASRLQIAYLRNMDRVCERSNFNTLFHCLKPVDLVGKSSTHMANNREHHRGNLYPLYKVNEDWIAP